MPFHSQSPQELLAQTSHSLVCNIPTRTDQTPVSQIPHGTVAKGLDWKIHNSISPLLFLTETHASRYTWGSPEEHEVYCARQPFYDQHLLRRAPHRRRGTTGQWRQARYARLLRALQV